MTNKKERLTQDVYVELRDLPVGVGVMFQEMSYVHRVGIEEYEFCLTGHDKRMVYNMMDMVGPIVVSIQEHGDLWCW